MPFEIVRNDIVNMQVDAVVNTANPRARIGYGVDAGIHRKAGPKLLEARREIGDIGVGCCAITPGFELDARFVIHAVGPVWYGGDHGEEQLLRQCYDRALQLALDHGCESIAFPLLSAGNHGVPKRVSLQTAINAFSSFLLEHEMQIYLVVFSREAVELSEKVFHAVASYIDETYIRETLLDEYGVSDKRAVQSEELSSLAFDNIRAMRRFRSARAYEAMRDIQPMSAVPTVPAVPAAPADHDLRALLDATDAGFSETLLKLIDRTGKKDSVIYKKANVDRKLFSKIRNNHDYRPSKSTALAFALALELSLEETQEFIARAGYTLTHSSKFDIIVEYFIKAKNYDVFELNEVLFAFDQPLIGA